MPKMKIEEISQHGVFIDQEHAYKHAAKLNSVEGSDNLQYVVKVEGGIYVVVLLARFNDNDLNSDNWQENHDTAK